MTKLSEKTLELNVISELTYIFRNAGYEPYYIGYSRLSEAIHGTDVGYSLGKGYFAFLQFKRGYKGIDFYSYSINNNRPYYDQHHKFISNSIISRAAFYIFPRIVNTDELLRFKSNILSRTVPIKATNFNPLVPSNESHRVRICNNGIWTCSSKPNKGRWNPIIPKNTNIDYSNSEDIEKIATNIINRLEFPKIKELYNDEVEEYIDKNLTDQKSSFAFLISEK